MKVLRGVPPDGTFEPIEHRVKDRIVAVSVVCVRRIDRVAPLDPDRILAVPEDRDKWDNRTLRDSGNAYSTACESPRRQAGKWAPIGARFLPRRVCQKESHPAGLGELRQHRILNSWRAVGCFRPVLASLPQIWHPRDCSAMHT
jgi:hypothetical protein